MLEDDRYRGDFRYRRVSDESVGESVEEAHPLAEGDFSKTLPRPTKPVERTKSPTSFIRLEDDDTFRIQPLEEREQADDVSPNAKTLDLECFEVPVSKRTSDGRVRSW